MFTLILLEFRKLVRSRSFYLSFAALFGFVLLMLWGFYSYVSVKAGAQAVEQFKYTYESKSYFNGLTFSLYSVLFSFSLLIPLFVTMTAGNTIAGEAEAGTLRMICVRPVSRNSILLAKFLIVGLHTYLLLAFFIVVNLVVGLVFIGWGNLELYPGPLNLVDEPGKILLGESLWRFTYASFSGTWALLVIAAIAVLFSALYDSPVMAVVITMAVYVMLYVIGRVEFFAHLRPYFFTTAMDFWRDVFKPDIPWISVYHYAAMCGIYIFGSLLAASIIFERKDITT
jgi:ABC-2 type transport system permease protein